MKRRKSVFLTIVMAVILCLTCSALCLTGCKDDDDGGSANHGKLNEVTLGAFEGDVKLAEKNADLKEVYTAHWLKGQGNKSYGEKSGKWSIASGWMSSSATMANGEMVPTYAKYDTAKFDYDAPDFDFEDGQSTYITGNKRAMFIWESEGYGKVSFNGLFAKSNTPVKELAKTQYELADNLYTGNIDVDNNMYNFVNGDKYTIDIWKVSSYGSVYRYSPFSKSYTSEFVYMIPEFEYTVFEGDKFVFTVTCNESGDDDKAVLTLLDATFTPQINKTLIDETIIKGSNKIASFFAISDTHINGYEDKHFPKLVQDMAQVDRDALAILNMGDLSERGWTTGYGDQIEQYYTQIAKDGNSLFNSKGERVPYYNIMGNHDTRGDTTAGSKVDGVTDVWQYWSDHKDEYFAEGLATYKAKEQAIGGDGFAWSSDGTGNNWVRNIGGVQVIGLNYYRIDNKWDDNFLSKADIEWLDATLTAYEIANPNKPQIVMIHGLDSDGSIYVCDENDVPYEAGSGYTFSEIINKHPSAIVTSGHTHHAFGWNYIQVGDANSASSVNMPGLNWNHAMAKPSEYGPGGVPWSGAGNTPTLQYYYIEIYENGVIFNAREFASKNWVQEAKVAILNPNLR